MSPASLLIKQFRLSRQLQQKIAADRLGYEQSFLSAIENGAKDIPKNEFIPRLIKVYELTDLEQVKLSEVLKTSNRKITVPLKASIEEFVMMNDLNRQLGKLKPKQIQLIQIALTI